MTTNPVLIGGPTPFREFALMLLDSGLGTPFPIGGPPKTNESGDTVDQSKAPFLGSVHGKDDEPIDQDRVEQWTEHYPDALSRGFNIGLVPAEGLVFVDVDEHPADGPDKKAKHGARNLAAALGLSGQELHALLTQTLHISARPGARLHGHWVFRVPPGTRLHRTVSGINDLEVIGPGRQGYFVVAPGSVHGVTKEIYRADVCGREIPIDALRQALAEGAIAPMPESLLDVLRDDRPDSERRVRRGHGEIQDWIAEQPEPDAAPGPELAEIVAAYEGGRGDYAVDNHDAALAVQRDLVNTAQRTGEPGLRAALSACEVARDLRDPGDWHRGLNGVSSPDDRYPVTVLADVVPLHFRRARAERAARREARGRDLTDDWQPVDLAAMWESNDQVAPEVAEMFYAGHVNTVFGPSESGKTWLALLAVRDTIGKGGRVVYFDSEDTPRGIIRRLKALGMSCVEVDSNLTYVNPNSYRKSGRDQHLEAVRAADLVVFDATTEFMAGMGLSSNSDVEVAEFMASLPKWASREGPAVVLIDHTVKNTESRDAGPQGSQHKRAAVDGAAFEVVGKEPFSPEDDDGHSHIYVNKDKQGGVASSRRGSKRFFGHLYGGRSGFHIADPAPKDRIVSVAESAGDKALRQERDLVGKVLRAVREYPPSKLGVNEVHRALKVQGATFTKAHVNRALLDRMVGAGFLDSNGHFKQLPREGWVGFDDEDRLRAIEGGDPREAEAF